MSRAAPDLPDEMRAVHGRFARWRKSHTGRLRIPEPLCAAATETAREYGVFRTAKVLQLEYGKLKRLTTELYPGGRRTARLSGDADVWRARCGARSGIRAASRRRCGRTGDGNGTAGGSLPAQRRRGAGADRIPQPDNRASGTSGGIGRRRPRDPAGKAPCRSAGAALTRYTRVVCRGALHSCNNSLVIRKAASLPRSPTSPGAPTHDGQPASHSHPVSSSAVCRTSRSAIR